MQVRPTGPILPPSNIQGNALLVVIAIIAILAGLVVVGMEFAKQRQASEKAKVQIALLSKGIEEYKADMGAYPGDLDDTPIDGKVSEQIYQALFKELPSETLKRRKEARYGI